MIKAKNQTQKTIRVPRYTSYPTALVFSEMDFIIYNKWLLQLDENEQYSLYLHIPYCHQMCLFCGCFTKITKYHQPVDEYTNYLVQEIALFHKIIGKKLNIRHIHFGGGSPSVLKENNLAAIMTTIRNSFNFCDDIEIAMEIDPRTTDRNKVNAYKAEGFNRISMGIQDFSEKVQKAVNREHSYAQIKELFSWLNDVGIKHINTDIMYGLPYQDINIIEQTLEKIIALSPARIAAFAYAHVPWIRKHQRLIPQEVIPQGQERFHMIRRINEVLNDNGYNTIGIDHYAKANDSMAQGLKSKKLRRNFQGYSTDEADNMIAFGVSSIGSLKQGFVQNENNMHQYKQHIDDNKLPIMRGYALKGDDLIRRDIISQLMCYQEVDLRQIAEKYNLVPSYFAKHLEKLQKITQMVQVNDNVVKVKDHILSRRVAAIFDAYIANDLLEELLFNPENRFLDVM